MTQAEIEWELRERILMDELEMRQAMENNPLTTSVGIATVKKEKNRKKEISLHGHVNFNILAKHHG